MERIAFVTGKLAEPAVRRVVAELAPKAGFEPVVVALPISVAALVTTDWAARHLMLPEGVNRVVLPGLCRGDLSTVADATGVPAERGPEDVRDLPDHFGQRRGPPPDYGRYDIEIVAEINHAPRLSRDELLAIARRYRADGADVIDVGCDPGTTWAGVADAVTALRDDGLRVSIDSFDPAEVAAATRAGAELVLSVNSLNVAAAADWGVEVVAIPDTPSDLASLDATAVALTAAGVRFRLDPILEPIGFGFAASLGRYLDVRRRHPDAALFMGVGNLTELTDADSAGVNVLLAGFCQECGIRGVLTTAVANWARSSVRELDLARRLVYHAIANGVPPKRLEPGLLLLRDAKVRDRGPAALAELAAAVKDRNYRLFADGGTLHVINASMHLTGDDPFALFAAMLARDTTLAPSHAFYLGYELAKAATALTLGKQYTQDRALTWGFLTRPEGHHE